MKAQRGGIFFKLLALLLLLLFVLGVYLVRHPLLRAAGQFWVVDEAPIHADAIILLSDDNYFGDRANRAAELFRAGWGPIVVASGRALRPYASISDLMQRDLVERGVPLSAILRMPHRADNTREEAVVLRQLISARGWRRVIVVTSNWHSRRARYICARLFPPGTELHVAAARDAEYDPDTWWESRGGVKKFFYETLGMIVAIWEARHDAEPSSSGLFLSPAID
jgi:uncharacterized SAM-binding protein YcdF (DUF218 family)